MVLDVALLPTHRDGDGSRWFPLSGLSLAFSQHVDSAILRSCVPVMPTSTSVIVLDVALLLTHRDGGGSHWFTLSGSSLAFSQTDRNETIARLHQFYKQVFFTGIHIVLTAGR